MLRVYKEEEEKQEGKERLHDCWKGYASSVETGGVGKRLLALTRIGHLLTKYTIYTKIVEEIEMLR